MLGRNILIGSLALLAFVGMAWAVQPGTTGTQKEFQRQGLRSAVLLQRNNTASATAGAATLNAAGSGVVTSESITTAAGADYTLTLTNNMIAAADVVLASGSLGTSTQGIPNVISVTPGANQVVVVVRNSHGSLAFNGTIKVSFLVVKQNADGSD